MPSKKPENVDRTPEQLRMALKKKVRMFYDIQRLRLQCGGRMHKSAKKGEIDLHEYDQKILADRAEELHKFEKESLKDVERHLKAISFYNDVLSDKTRYRGIGPTMAGVILSEFDITRQDNPSQMWSFAGLAPVPAWRCKICQQVIENKSNGEEVFKHPKTKIKCEKSGEILSRSEVFESGKAAKPKRGEKLPYNAFLRSKLCGVLGDVLIKCKSPWTAVYYDRKFRRKNQGWGVSDSHRHHDAIRYMIKMLLLDIWIKWREHEGLPGRAPYHEEKLGHKHTGDILDRFEAMQREAANDDPEIEAEMEQVSQ